MKYLITSSFNTCNTQIIITTLTKIRNKRNRGKSGSNDFYRKYNG